MSFSDGRFALLLYFVSLPVVWWLINVAVTQPYMDEIFHVPQTQRFCALDFTHWDDKITTLPGLYLFSTLFSFAAGCSVASLRFFNLLWSIGCAWVLNELLSQWQPHLTPEQRRWKLLELLLSPVFWFFHFLYYTDSCSTFWVFACVLMARRQRAASSAFCGLIAVLCRQSNIVWAAFAALQLLSLQFYSQTKNIDNVKSEATVFFRYLLQWTWVYACLPFLLLAGAFFAFLVWNKGIVVGDRSNHIAILHVPQMLYFCLFTLAHLAPSLITQRRAVFDIFAFWRRHLFLFICSCAALTVVIHQFTFVHPFILADNRHFTFYIWRLLFQRPLTRYGLIPIYIFAVSFMIHTLRNATRLWQLGFWLCSAAALIPTPLLEPRYFIVPLLLFQLQARETQSIFNLLVYIVVDLIVLTLFVARPFQWADGSIARFMY